MTPDDADGRSLFRYVVASEWPDYRAIMAFFAGTFFSEFSPAEVSAHLGDRAWPIAEDLVAVRLEQLVQWGNLTVSSSVGNPTSLADYYRRRNRYLITSAGQEITELVEGVLGRVDDVRDVSTGRLRQLQRGLGALVSLDLSAATSAEAAELVAAVFEPHAAFTSEITQFFAAINQWQSRYDLSVDEFTFFAEVLVTYVSERLGEVERTSVPIAVLVEQLIPRTAELVAAGGDGLAARVAQAGLDETVSVRRVRGSQEEDWEHLASWFLPHGGRPARIRQLTRDAIAAVRTLTLNLTRLNRVGTEGTSRRADLLRLAAFAHRSDPGLVPDLMAAALGLYPSVHLGTEAADAHDPVGSSTAWLDAPRAEVPISLRARGDTTNRGRPSAIPDRTLAQEALRRRRELERAEQARVEAELLDGPLEGRELTPAALHRLQALVARTLHGLGPGTSRSEHVEGTIGCVVARRVGAATVVRTPDGELTLVDLEVEVRAGSLDEARSEP